MMYMHYVVDLHTSLAACLMTSLADALHIAGTVSTHLMTSVLQDIPCVLI